MEVFRDLYVSIEPDRMAVTADLIERDPPSGWARDRTAEARVRSAPALTPTTTYCFTSSGDCATALLILTQKDPGTFFVSNVIPLSKHQLEPGEYNTIVEDFYNRVIRPYIGPGGGTANLSGSQADLENWMPHETAELLRQFSASANRGTGSSHPNDRDRWNAFVLSAHKSGSTMDAVDLRRWLIEVDRWAPEIAEQLAVEYVYGRELLAFAEGRRRSA